MLRYTLHFNFFQVGFSNSTIEKRQTHSSKSLSDVSKVENVLFNSLIACIHSHFGAVALMSNQISPKGVGVDFRRSTYRKIEPALSQKTVTIFVEIQLHLIDGK